MNTISVFMIVSFVVYLIVGILVISLDKNSKLNRSFFALNLSFAIWAFTAAYQLAAPSKEASSVWSSIGAVGYYSFSCITLHFFLIYTKKDALLRKWWTYVILYLPFVFFTYKAFESNFLVEGFIQTRYGWIAVQYTGTIWFGIYITQYVAYCFAGILMCYFWYRRLKIPRERKQAAIIILSAASTLLICSILYVLTWALDSDLPDLSPIGAIVWSVGIMYGIVKYRLMTLTPALAAENIMQTIIDSVILLDMDGNIISANHETQKLLGYKSGELKGKPIDMLFKYTPAHVSQRASEMIKNCPIRNVEMLFLSKDGKQTPVMFSASQCRDSDDHPIGYIAVSRDITFLKTAEERMKYLAHHDTLTSLPNRLLFTDRMEQSMARAKRSGKYLALLLLDLDKFKDVNDQYGHDTGDKLLIKTSQRLSSAVRKCDSVARMGGDEFVILLNDLNDPQDHASIAQRILELISAPCMIDSNTLHITASIGISIYPDNGTDLVTLIKHADLAMYNVKNTGRNGFRLFTSFISKKTGNKSGFEHDLYRSLQNNEIVLHYQPMIDIYSGMIIGVEAAAYWDHGEHGQIQPSEFLPLAEDTGYIIPLGQWVLKKACGQARSWQDAGYDPVAISVGISDLQFRQKDFIDVVLRTLEETRLDPKNLFLEMTENTIMNDPEKAIEILQELSRHNIKVIMDDFGTGYPSLLYLRKLPLYAIKINKYFIKDIPNDPEYASIVTAVIAMAHNIKLKVIAEGIEDLDQYRSLRSFKWEMVGSPVCDGAQGRLFSNPVPEEQMAQMLKNQKSGISIISELAATDSAAF